MSIRLDSILRGRSTCSAERGETSKPPAADIAAAVEDRRSAMVTLLSEVARNYIELRGTQLQLSIVRENLAAERQTLDIVKDKRRAGLITDLDVSRQQAQLDATRAQVPMLVAQVRMSIHVLGILLADDPDALSDELETESALPPLPPEVPVGLPSELLRRRPDIRSAERQLAAATARVGVATADLFPRFSITGQFGLDTTTPKKLFNWDSRYFLLSPGVSWPILDFGKIRSNIAVQNELTLQAATNYQSVVLQSLREVEDSISNYRQEQLRRAALLDAVKANEDSVNLAAGSIQAGSRRFSHRAGRRARALFGARSTGPERPAGRDESDRDLQSAGRRVGDRAARE